MITLSDGVYQLIAGGNFDLQDMAFNERYAWALQAHGERKGVKPAAQISVAIADSGIFSSGYFDERFARGKGDRVRGKDFSGDHVRRSNGRPDTTGPHGSHVASIASFGIGMIKLIDVMVCSSQEAGQNDPAKWVNALNWAAGKRPVAVNCSVQTPWEHPEVHRIVQQSPTVIFVATAGNSDTMINAESRQGMALACDNTILVGGCGSEGETVPDRGYGTAVDIFAPSVGIPGTIAPEVMQAKHDLDTRLRHERWARGRDQWLREQAGQNAQDIEEVERELMTASLFAKAGLERRLRGLRNPTYPDREPQARPFEYNPIRRDDGTSFALPMVTNVAAKMYLLNPTLTPVEIINRLKQSAHRVEGRRVMNPTAAYDAAMG